MIISIATLSPEKTVMPASGGTRDKPHWCHLY
jgi:hypothetical protein